MPFNWCHSVCWEPMAGLAISDVPWVEQPNLIKKNQTSTAIKVMIITIDVKYIMLILMKGNVNLVL